MEQVNMVQDGKGFIAGGVAEPFVDLIVFRLCGICWTSSFASLC